MTTLDDRRARIDALPDRQPLGSGTRMFQDAGLITHVLTQGSGFLLMAMDPAFSAVAQQYSTFRTDPIGRAVRSLYSVMTWVYAGPASLAEADRLREAHAHLRAEGEDGTRYTALAADSWAWVMHTTIWAHFTHTARFSRRPLTTTETEAVYREAIQLMRNLVLAPDHIPPTYAEWDTWFTDQLTHRLRNTDTARQYLAVIATLAPPTHLSPLRRLLWRAAAAPLRPLLMLCTVGTLPEPARRTLGLHWSRRRERTLRAVSWGIAHLLPLLPQRLRYLPIAYEAHRAERARARLDTAIDTRPR
ncbi:oxygenase MpaB family protein [Nocardia terpenica]|uniref:DUF2236 domain-containing protein n=1 Tax=Nocardia terpenica TaxID=455432 RepID=A0A6G9ZF57_9NOCA|nr:oxygenase MpaB family protein [Nocardia terpenica]QIS23623.1 DUF2236 domain-containing protein [Nocardia terpenica]